MLLSTKKAGASNNSCGHGEGGEPKSLLWTLSEERSEESFQGGRLFGENFYKILRVRKAVPKATPR